MGLAKQKPDWAFGYQDETWWSRFAHPDLHSWAEGDQFLKLIEQTPQKNDPDPKAIGCYGLAVHWYEQTETEHAEVWLRFVEGNPCSNLTIQYLDWLLEKTRRAGKQVLIMIWDHASWHKSKAVRQWVRNHNRIVKKDRAGVRLLPFLLPKKSPWLNPIEPMWIHAKRKVVEPDKKITASELVRRVSAVFEHPVLPYLTLSENVS
jgi:transposase